MSSEDFVNKFMNHRSEAWLEHRICTQKRRVAGTEYESEDAVMVNGKYRGLRISELYLIDPRFVNAIIKYHGTPLQLRKIAESVVRYQEQHADAISREIALD